MPVMLPAELWQRSGRYGIPELFKLQDRKGAELVLAMTHEEAVTQHVAQVVRSYRQLPFSLYHFQIKERDEPRPRAGLLRTREFIMKDAYTFDRDKEGLDAHYERYREAYDRVMDRCGIEWYRVESDVGAMGGHGAHEYMAPSPAGRERRRAGPGLRRQRRDRHAPTRSPSSCRQSIDAPEIVETPGLVTVADVSGRMEVPAGALLKAYPVMVEDRGLVHGDGPRRPSRQRHQAAERARRLVPARARGGVRRPRRPAGLHRPGRRSTSRSCSTTPSSRGPTSRAPTARTRTCAASSPAATSRSSAATCARSRPATPSTAARSGSSPRSRSATSSSSARATRTRSARPTSTSRGSPSRSGWAPTASAPPACRPRPSSSTPTSRASRGRASMAPFDVHLVGPRQGRQRGARARRAPVRGAARGRARGRLRRPRRRARARSSPTRSCSGCRCG